MKKLFPLLLVLLLATVSFAQNKSRIAGTVTTAEGAVITGVNVTISSGALIGSTMSTSTNERGVFRFVLLPVGTYDVKFAKEGYKTIEHKGIELGFDATATVDQVMEPSDFEELILITGEAPIIDKTSSGIGDKLGTEFLNNTPNTRMIWDLPNLSAGFNDNTAFGSIEKAAQAYNTDGVNVSDPLNGQSFSEFNLEAVEQFDVSMFGAPAEYGAFTGASFNVVTKSGGNEFHGEINYFAQNKNWVSDNTFKFKMFGITIPEARNLTDPNFAIGGPLVKDRIWFFANYNYKKWTTERELLDGVITQDEKPTQSFIKLSSRWNDKNISYLSWQRFDAAISHLDKGTPWIMHRRSSLWTEERDSNTYLFQHSFVASDSLIFEGRYAGFTANKDTLPLGGSGPGNPMMFDYAFGYHMPGSSGARNQLTSRERNNYLITASYFDDGFAGSHSFKFGFEHERSAGATGSTPYTMENYFMGMSYIKFEHGNKNDDTIIKRYAGFVQDSWSVNNRLTLNIGFRIDTTKEFAAKPDKSPAGNEAIISFRDPAYRLGFAYDLFGDGKTILRGFTGRYYEGIVVGAFSAMASYNEPAYTYMGQAMFGPFAPVWTLTYVDPGASAYAVDDDISNTYTDGFLIGLERELTPYLAGSINFVYKKDTNIIGTIDPGAMFMKSDVSFSSPNGSYIGPFYNYLGSNPSIPMLITNPRSDNSDNIPVDPWRKYYGLTMQLSKRMSDNWSMKANYTFSRSTTNLYLGQDAASITGGLNWDFPNFWINAGGRAPFDRPHVFKLTGTYVAPYDILISPVITYHSGTPYPIQYLGGGWIPVLVKKTDGKDRYPDIFNADVRMEKTFTFGETYRLGILFDVFNLTNEDAITAFASTAIDAPAYLMPTNIVAPRFYQLGVRFTF